MKVFKRFLVVAGTCLAAFGMQASCYEYNTAGGTANLGASTQINSTDRICLFQGTVNLNAGASIVCGGNESGSCNFLGVDKSNAATLNVNGGTLHCSLAKGAGFLKLSANDYNQTATLNINSGTVTVDRELWTCTHWNNNNGSAGRGIVNVNGGTLDVNNFIVGADANSSGTTEVFLRLGVLAVNKIQFRSYNKQVVSLEGGILRAKAVNIFDVTTYPYQDTEGRVIQIANRHTVTFDNAGFNQVIPTMIGNGVLRLTGQGTFSCAEPEQTICIQLAGTMLNLGTLSADTTALMLPTNGFSAVAASTLAVMLPENPSGRYALVSGVLSRAVLDYLTVTGGGAGRLVLEDGTLYLDFSGAAEKGLVYSDANGGTDSPSGEHGYLSFLNGAGAFTLGSEGLTLTEHGAIYDASTAAQTITAPVDFSAPLADIEVAAGGSLALNGKITATNLQKTGDGALVFGHPESSFSKLVLGGGLIDFGGNTYTGKVSVLAECRGMGREMVLTNGTFVSRLVGSADDRLDYRDYHIRIAKGAVLDLSGTGRAGDWGRVAIGNATVAAYGDDSVETRFTVEGGTVILGGNHSGNCNFVGVDQPGTAILEILDGVFRATNANANTSWSSGGALRIAANSSATGIVRVKGGRFEIPYDLSLATQYNNTNGGSGNATFEQTGGFSDLCYSYIGFASAGSGSGTMNLTGGEMSCVFLYALGYGTQTLYIDNYTIHAESNDNANYGFLCTAGSKDSYPKSYTVGEHGFTADTAGHSVSMSIPFAGPGAITVTGGGTMTMRGDLANAGGIIVDAGTTLSFAGNRKVTGPIVFADGTAFKTTLPDDGTVTTIEAPLVTPSEGRITLRVAGSTYARGTFLTGNLSQFNLANVDVVCEDENFQGQLVVVNGQIELLVAPKESAIWTGAISTAWSIGSNWASGFAPLADRALVFDAADRLVSENDLAAGTTYTSLTFGERAGAYTINGNAFALSAATPIQQFNAVTNVINAPVSLGANTTIRQVNPAGGLVLAKVTATGDLKKDGAGMLALGDVSGFNGNVTISDGLLKFTDPQHFLPSSKAVKTSPGTGRRPIIDFGGATTAAQVGLGSVLNCPSEIRNGTWNLGNSEMKLGVNYVVFGEGMNFVTTSRLLMGNGNGNNGAHLELLEGAGTVAFGGNSSGVCNFLTVDTSYTSTITIRGGLMHFSSTVNRDGGYFRTSCAQNNSLTPNSIIEVFGGEMRADKAITLSTPYNGEAQLANPSHGTTTATISGTGLVNTPYLGEGMTSGASRDKVYLTVKDGGTLEVGELRANAYGSVTNTFDGGVVKAKKDNAQWLNDVTPAENYGHKWSIGAKGLTFDLAGYSVGVNVAFAATGDIVVTNTATTAGTFTLNQTLLPAARTLKLSGGTMLRLGEGTAFDGKVAFDKGSEVVVDESVKVKLNTVLLTASAITGLPSGIVKNGRPYSCRLKIEDVEGGQSLVACAGAMVIYVR